MKNIERIMPMERKLYEVVVTVAKAIIIRCPDRRFRRAHKLFITEDLGLAGEDFWPIKMAGGAGILARPDEMPHDFACLSGQIATFCAHDPIRYIVLLGHEDCRRYDKIRSAAGNSPEREDLYRAIDLVSGEYPNVEVSAYYATFSDQFRTHVFFDPIKECSLMKSLQPAGCC